MRAGRLLPLLLLLGGCVYYNGMYNTKNLAKRARHAEREGRTFEAQNLWGQVAVKAETLLVHHPRSKYAEEAQLLYGTARAKLNDCPRALPSLENVMLSGRNPVFAEDAAEMVGWCRVALGEPGNAASAYARLTTSRNPARRDLALYAHGQALRLGGQYAEAYTELSASHDRRAQGERAAALAGVGDVDGAGLVIDSLLAANDSTAPWSDITALVGARDVNAASALTDRLIASPAINPSRRGRLLIDDAERLAPVDPERSFARLGMVESAAAGTERVAEAQMFLARRRLAQVASVDSMRQVLSELVDLEEGAGTMLPQVQRLTTQARKVVTAADSVPAGSAQGDLRLFLAGEIARDSLGAARFAATQFRRVVDEWPNSPFAPKALLALIDLQPVDIDSLQSRMRTTYISSPYLIAVEGGESPQLGELEDSLRRFVASYQTGRVPQRGTPAQGRPSQPNRPTTEPQF